MERKSLFIEENPNDIAVQKPSNVMENVSTEGSCYIAIPRAQGRMRVWLALLFAGALASGAPPALESTPSGLLLAAVLDLRLPSHELVLRAHHRASLAQDLPGDAVCTSLSGPGCKAGVEATPALWTRTRVEPPLHPPDHLTTFLQPSLLPGGRVFSWSFLTGTTSFASRLAASEQTLVLFFGRECAECEEAADAIRAAAPFLLTREKQLRFLAVGCAPGSPSAPFCAQYVQPAGQLPHVRLFFGSHLLSTVMRAKEEVESSSSSSSSDSDSEEEEEVASPWTANAVIRFHLASTTPTTRAMMATAHSLLSPFLSGVSAQSALAKRLAAQVGGGDGDDGEEEGEEVEADGTRLVGSALAALIAGRLQEGGDAAVSAFSASVAALLSEHDTGVTGAEDGLPSQMRSMPSRVRRHLVVENARSLPIDVLWIDFQGGERVFAQVSPGRSVRLATFASHLWRIREAHTSKHLSYVTVRELKGEESDTYKIVVS